MFSSSVMVGWDARALEECVLSPMLRNFSLGKARRSTVLGGVALAFAVLLLRFRVFSSASMELAIALTSERLDSESPRLDSALSLDVNIGFKASILGSEVFVAELWSIVFSVRSYVSIGVAFMLVDIFVEIGRRAEFMNGERLDSGCYPLFCRVSNCDCT